MKKTGMSLTEGALLPRIIRYTIPIILTGLLQLLFNAADLVVVGQFCGSVAVAAVGATSALINLMVGLFMGTSIGVSVGVAQGLGAQRHEDVRRTVHSAIPLALLFGVVLTAGGIPLARTFLQLMGTPDDVIGMSAVYMRIYFCGIIPNLLYNFGTAILQASGDTRTPLKYLSIAGGLNVVLNVFFVAALGMDVDGVALATVLSQTLSAVLILRCLCRREDDCRLVLKSLRFHGKQVWQILRVGLPSGLQSSLFSISNVIIQSSINSFGSVVMSGNAAAGNLEGFVYISMFSFRAASMNFTGQCLGAGNYRRMQRSLLTCLGCVGVVGIAMGLLVYMLGHPLLSLYITDSPDAIRLGLVRLRYICLPYFLCGMMDVGAGALCGLGSSVTPMLIAVIGVCGMRLAWIYTLFRMPLYHTPAFLYLSYPISWALTLFATMAAYFIICRRRCRQPEKNVP